MEANRGTSVRGDARKITRSLALPRCATYGKIAFQSRRQAKRFSRCRDFFKTHDVYRCSSGVWHLATSKEKK